MPVWESAVTKATLALLFVLLCTPDALGYEKLGNSCDEAKVLIVLDRSGSMNEYERGGRPISQARQAVVMVAELVGPNDHLGLVVFNNKGSINVALAPNSRQEVADRAREMSARGGTSFNAGLRKALQAIQEASVTGVLVVFISDGDDPARIKSSYIDDLRLLDVRLNTIATGANANSSKLSDLSSKFGGWSRRVVHSSLRATLVQMIDEVRCQRTVGDIRDVIRPTESQEFGIDLNGTGDEVQFTGTWEEGELAFTATSPKGKVYTSDEFGQGGLSGGGSEETYRILRVPSKSGHWRFRVDIRDGAEEGEPSRITVATMQDEGVRLVPPSDYNSPGQPIEISLADCNEEVSGTLFEKGEPSTPFEFRPGPGNTCVASLQAPAAAGFYPVAIQPEKGHRLWTTVSVGSVRAIVAARDEWRPERQPWSKGSAGSGGSAGKTLLLFAFIFGVVFFVVKQRREESKANVTQAPAATAASPGPGDDPAPPSPSNS